MAVIGREAQGSYCTCVTAERTLTDPSRKVPNLQGLIPRRRNRMLPVGSESYSCYLVKVPGKDLNEGGPPAVAGRLLAVATMCDP